MLLKLIALIAVLSAVYFIFFKKTRTEEIDENKKKRKMGDEVMIECVKCGTYVSNKEAFIKDGKFFCSKECME